MVPQVSLLLFVLPQTYQPLNWHVIIKVNHIIIFLLYKSLMENSSAQAEKKKYNNAVNNLDDFEINFFDDDSDGELEEDDRALNSKKDLPDTASVTSNSLLRATICELERALTDTRRLLLVRDKESATLRQELEKARKDLHREQQVRKKLERESESKEEKRRKDENEKSKLAEEIKELKEKLREFENPQQGSDPEEIVPCCSSMHELVELQRKLKETEKQLTDFKANNQFLNSEQKILATMPQFPNKSASPKNHRQTQREMQTQLKLKFLRDAFFYYMIDFHADEQMRAILAILDYEDRRHEIIIESHKMKRQGKKFTVTEVSSRSLTFVQEEKL